MPHSGYAEIQPGDSCTLEREITAQMVQAFAELTGDYNPVHMDDAYCAEHGYGLKTVHGLLTVSFVSALIGMYLPGEGSVCLSHSFDFIAPVFVGDTLRLTGRVVKKDGSNALRLNIVTLKTEISNQHRRLVARGTSKISVK